MLSLKKAFTYVKSWMFIALAALCLPVIAAGENPATETGHSYIVTAHRDKEDPMETAASVTIITADNIAKSGKTSIIDILENTAGISFHSYSGEAQAQISMRGFGENSFGRVQVLIDGKKLNNPDMQGINWLSIPLSGIDRIEILDGPAAAVYGSGSVGGVINIITKESADDFSASVIISGGSFYTGRAQFNMNIAGNTAGAAVSVDQHNTRGYRDRSGSRSTNALASGYIDITDTITIKPSLFFTDIVYEMPGSLTETQFNDNPRQALNRSDDAKEINAGGSLLFQWQPMEKLSIEIPADYTFRDIKTNMASWGSFSDRKIHLTELRPRASYGIQSDGLLKELRASAGVDFAAAGLFNRSFNDIQRRTETNKFSITQYQLAPFVSINMSLPAGFSAGASLRYDGSFLTAKNKDSSIDNSIFYNAFVYDLSVLYRPINQVSVYVKGGTLFRYPFTDEVTSLYGFGTDNFNKDLKPETGYNIEAGIKTDFGDLLKLQANAYYMPMNNEIIYNNVTYNNENTGQTLHTGCTINISSIPVSFMKIHGSFSYVWAVSTAGADKWKKIPLVPDMEAAAEILFYIPAGFTAAAEVTWTAPSYQGGDFSNSQKQISGYVLPGISLRYTPPQLKDRLAIQMRVSNLLDLQYAPYQYYSPYTGTALYPAQGRTISVSVSYQQ